jgi:hypothetical protein
MAAGRPPTRERLSPESDALGAPGLEAGRNRLLLPFCSPAWRARGGGGGTGGRSRGPKGPTTFSDLPAPNDSDFGRFARLPDSGSVPVGPGPGPRPHRPCWIRLRPWPMPGTAGLLLCKSATTRRNDRPGACPPLAQPRSQVPLQASESAVCFGWARAKTGNDSEGRRVTAARRAAGLPRGPRLTRIDDRLRRTIESDGRSDARPPPRPCAASLRWTRLGLGGRSVA